MRVAVIGSRGFTDYSKLEQELDKLMSIELIISGGAKGADQFAEKYAESRNIQTKIIKPDYKAHKQGAPIRRNEKIVQEAELVVAFWDGKSRGTKYVIEYSRNHRREVKTIKF